MARTRRTHTCGELREAHLGQTVVLNGWVNTYRNQGALVFIDLRDRYGVTQVVFEADRPELATAAKELRSEFFIAVRGQVAKRLPGKEKPDLATGARDAFQTTQSQDGARPDGSHTPSSRRNGTSGPVCRSISSCSAVDSATWMQTGQRRAAASMRALWTLDGACGLTPGRQVAVAGWAPDQARNSDQARRARSAGRPSSS